MLGKVRIIGGRWRRRILHFPATADLRPTQDRIRETLFNWLSPIIEGASCLDLFAGSGALGFEALSRGAKQVTFVEQEPLVVKALQENQRLLQAENCHIIAGKFPTLSLPKQTFDIVFLDPPYHQGLLELALIWAMPLLTPQAVIYFEAEKNLLIQPPSGMRLYRFAQTKSLQYGLLKIEGKNE